MYKCFKCNADFLLLLFSLTAQRNLYINRFYNLQAGGAPLHPPAWPLGCYHIACEYCLLLDLCSSAACIVNCYVSEIKYLLYGNLEARVIES